MKKLSTSPNPSHQPTVKLSFTFHPDETFHGDLLLVVGTVEQRCDSYYFAIDPGLDPKSENDAKVRRVLRRLLQQWFAGVEQLDAGSTVYLPFDYSDQYTGCLQVVRQADLVDVRVGTSSREGWATNPSDISDYMRGAFDFTARYPALRLTHEELLSCIRDSEQRA